MAFMGSAFTFNGISCEDFDLMLYTIGTEDQGGSFASTVTIIEENLAAKWKPVFYGTKFEQKLEFELTFGANEQRLDEGRYFDRYELDAIASWLTGHDSYKWLSIVQDDLAHVRYKCIITNLTVTEYGRVPWAFQATVTCDSPYAYTYPHEFLYTINGSSNIDFFNESSHNGYLEPLIEIEPATGGAFTIINDTDGGRKTEFVNIPASVLKINIDNERRIITDSAGLNLYPYFNFMFFRLKRGLNKLRVIGDGTLRIICEFPINTGG